MNSLLPVLTAFVRRDWENARSYRLAFVFQFISLIFELALYYYLGRLVDRTEIASNSAVDQGYFAFVVVGRSLHSLVMHGMMTFTQSVQVEQVGGSLEAIMMTPQRPALLIAMGSTYSSIHMLISEVLLILIAVIFFGLRFDTNPLALLGAVAAAVACLLLFASIGLIVAGATLVVKRGTTRLVGFAGSALALVGGVYYPVDVLPGPLQMVAAVLPFTWALEILRFALFADEFRFGRFALLASAAAVAMPLGLWFFRAGLARARREGSLGHY